MSTQKPKTLIKRARELTDKRIEQMKTGCQCDCIEGHPKLNENRKPFTRIFYNNTGLFIEISKTNRKTFRYVYRDIEGKQKLVTIGRFNIDGDNTNNFNLNQAKCIYSLAIDKLKQHKLDPQDEKKSKITNLQTENNRNKTTFAILKDEWINQAGFMPSHRQKVEQRIRRYCQGLMSKPVCEITENDVREILEIVLNGRQDAARRLYASFRQMFEYARKVKKVIAVDPMGNIYSSEFPAVKTKSFAHSLDYITLQKILKLIQNNNTGNISTYTALKIAPYLFVRPGELRLMRWQDIDFERRIWSTHKAKVIGREIASEDTRELPFDFFVPLSSQVISLLKDLQKIRTCDYVFSADGNKPPSDSTFSKALRELLKTNGLSGKQTVHGFRHVFRSFAENKLKIPARVVEQQMSHTGTPKSGDKHKYDQNLMIPERRALMDVYADFIDLIRDVYKEYSASELEEGEETTTEYSKRMVGIIADYPKRVRRYEQVTLYD